MEISKSGHRKERKLDMVFGEMDIGENENLEELKFQNGFSEKENLEK